MKFNTNSFLGFLGRVLDGFLKSQNTKTTKPGSKPASTRPVSRQDTKPQSSKKSSSNAHRATAPHKGSSSGEATVFGWENGGYPGDFRGKVNAQYNPEADGQPDPGEIVWAWIPYEEDYSQGKDRPVLLVGKDGKYLLALMMTSKDRNNPTHRDRDYVDIGSGPWDKQGRASEVKVDRVIRLHAEGIRREGAVLDKNRFSRVAAALNSL